MMNDNLGLSVHDKRALSKMGLETFYFNKHNYFDVDIEKLISVKEEVLNKHKRNVDTLVNDTGSKSTEADIEADQKEYMILTEAVYYEEQELQTLVEMQIVYAFKMFEIGLKQLLSSVFNLNNNRELYKWESIVRLLAGKGLKISKIAHYQSINQLRLVNNAIKHSGVITPEIKKIPEFTASTDLSYQNLIQFYERIKAVPIKFSEALVDEIYQFLYRFDDDRIQNIATKIVLRMEKDDVIKLTNALRSLYK